LIFFLSHLHYSFLELILFSNFNPKGSKMPDVNSTKDQIFTIANQLTTDGIPVTLPQVRQQLNSGSIAETMTHLDEWRENQRLHTPSITPTQILTVAKDVWVKALDQAEVMLSSEINSVEQAQQDILCLQEDRASLLDEIQRLSNENTELKENILRLKSENTKPKELKSKDQKIKKITKSVIALADPTPAPTKQTKQIKKDKSTLTKTMPKPIDVKNTDTEKTNTKETDNTELLTQTLSLVSSGKGWSKVVPVLNEKGFITPRGKAYTGSNLQALLRSLSNDKTSPHNEIASKIIKKRKGMFKSTEAKDTKKATNGFNYSPFYKTALTFVPTVKSWQALGREMGKTKLKTSRGMSWNIDNVIFRVKADLKNANSNFHQSAVEVDQLMRNKKS
jgi:hypothetical protein